MSSKSHVASDVSPADSTAIGTTIASIDRDLDSSHGPVHSLDVDSAPMCRDSPLRNTADAYHAGVDPRSPVAAKIALLEARAATLENQLARQEAETNAIVERYEFLLDDRLCEPHRSADRSNRPGDTRTDRPDDSYQFVPATVRSRFLQWIAGRL